MLSGYVPSVQHAVNFMGNGSRQPALAAYTFLFLVRSCPGLRGSDRWRGAVISGQRLPHPVKSGQIRWPRAVAKSGQVGHNDGGEAARRTGSARTTAMWLLSGPVHWAISRMEADEEYSTRKGAALRSGPDDSGQESRKGKRYEFEMGACGPEGPAHGTAYGLESRHYAKNPPQLGMNGEAIHVGPKYVATRQQKTTMA